MYIKRNLEEKIRKYLSAPEIIAVVGPRQSGKTTLLKHIQVEIKNSTFITLEDAEIRTLFNRDIKSFIELYVKPYNYIFIDEFQYADNGGKNLKFIYDTVRGKKIFISGSSVLELTVKTVKYLVGRIFSFSLYPFDFQEYLSYKDANFYEYYQKLGKKGKLDEVLIKRFYSLLNEFLTYGGFPRVVISKDNEEREEVLRNILNVYLLKDIRDVLGLTDDYRVISLIKLLSLQIGNVISYQELATATHQNFTSLKKYLNLLEKTYIIQQVKPFFTNKRTELVKNPKVYFCDTGLRNCAIQDFRSCDVRTDKGALYENFIFAELIKKNFTLKYWRTKAKAEVDFVINDRIPIEVKSLLSKPVIGKSLYSFIEKHHSKDVLIFNENFLKKVKIDNVDFHFLYHFLVSHSLFLVNLNQGNS